jgi:shikimate dehydrogenase
MAESPRAFVAGHPIRHSRSPLIHSSWLSRYGINGSYTAIDVAPENLAALMDSVRSGTWAGGNVTIPHKEAACRLADRLDGAAEAIGAVNTLWLDDGKLIGGNTDAYGFAANLDQRLPGWRDAGRGLVFGAGGASRAVVHALVEAGFERIEIVNRTEQRARELAARFGEKVHAHGWDAGETLVREAGLLVNTTSLGMEGHAPMEFDFSHANNGALATDIVYAPLETPFLKLTKSAGLKTCDGLGMLLHQAAPGFERWFGRRPEVDDALRDIVIADLNKRYSA